MPPDALHILVDLSQTRKVQVPKPVQEAKLHHHEDTPRHNDDFGTTIHPVAPRDPSYGLTPPLTLPSTVSSIRI